MLAPIIILGVAVLTGLGLSWYGDNRDKSPDDIAIPTRPKELSRLADAERVAHESFLRQQHSEFFPVKLSANKVIAEAVSKIGRGEVESKSYETTGRRFYFNVDYLLNHLLVLNCDDQLLSYASTSGGSAHVYIYGPKSMPTHDGVFYNLYCTDRMCGYVADLKFPLAEADSSVRQFVFEKCGDWE